WRRQRRVRSRRSAGRNLHAEASGCTGGRMNAAPQRRTTRADRRNEDEGLVGRLMAYVRMSMDARREHLKELRPLFEEFKRYDNMYELPPVVQKAVLDVVNAETQHHEALSDVLRRLVDNVASIEAAVNGRRR